MTPKIRIAAAFLLLCAAGRAQLPGPDSVSAPPVPAEEKAPADTVRYSADTILYSQNDSLLTLIGHAELFNRASHLKADTIFFYTHTKFLEANGHPVLLDGGDVITGERMSYRINERRGRVTYGTARSKNDVYNGADIGRMEDQSFLVRNGDFSTCEIDSAPHFFFFSKFMKVVPNDKVIARPVVMNIGDVPVGVLPYFIFPINRGRHSGILTPRWGEFSDQGTRASYLNNVGYYFALGDYNDLETKMDFTNGDGFFFKRIFLNTDFRYLKRYWLDGYVNGRMEVSRSEESLRRNYNLAYSHSQALLPDRSFYLRGAGNLAGNADYYRQSSLDRQDYLKRQLNANMAVSRIWQRQGLSANADFRYDQNLDSREKTLSLPSFSFTSSQRSLFPARRLEDGTLPPPDSLPWYHGIKWSYATRGINRQETKKVRRLNLLDTTVDTSSFLRSSQAADLRHDMSFGLSPAPRLGPVNFSPGISASSHWYFKERRLAHDKPLKVDTLRAYGTTVLDTVFAYDTVDAFNQRVESSASLSAGTQLYGTALFSLGPLRGFRHTLQPSVGYTFSPELKGGEKYVSAGTTNTANRGEQQSVNVGLGNKFQLKLSGEAGDKTLTLTDLGLGTSYNFAGRGGAGEWAPLSSSASTNLYVLNLSYNGQHSFYDDDNRLVFNRPGLKGNERLPRFRSLHLSANTGAQLGGKFWNGELETRSLAAPAPPVMNPWGLNLQFSYNFTRNYHPQFRVTESSSSFSLRDNLTLNFTDLWQLSYSSFYDFQNNELVDQTVDLTRDLHCWTAAFNWVISGYRSGYYFRVNIKEIPDLKFEKRDGAAGAYLGGGYPNFGGY